MLLFGPHKILLPCLYVSQVCEMLPLLALRLSNRCIVQSDTYVPPAYACALCLAPTAGIGGVEAIEMHGCLQREDNSRENR
jgi:hypothetical protein